MGKATIYSKRLTQVQKEISLQLAHITHLQELLRQEEEKLYSYLLQEKTLKIALGPIESRQYQTSQ
jgi:hypothetical protein